MFSIIFLVCSPVSGECKTLASRFVYPTEVACSTEAQDLITQVYTMQKEGKAPPEQIVFKCVAWGDPA